MSGGGGGGRYDLEPGVGGGANQCGQSYTAPINSPKPHILGPLPVGTVLEVDVQTAGTSSVLVVRDAAGNLAGALTFLGYITVINCIVQQGVVYTATIEAISGGVYTVKVEPL